MKSLSEGIAQMTYNKSANPYAPENLNEDFWDGYEAGASCEDNGHLAVMDREWERCTFKAGFLEFKRGVWAATFCRVQNKPCYVLDRSKVQLAATSRV